jgi:hypothetical protein
VFFYTGHKLGVAFARKGIYFLFQIGYWYAFFKVCREQFSFGYLIFLPPGKVKHNLKKEEK